MLTPDDLECLKQLHDVGRRLEVRLNQVLAERDELEKALDIKHAKLVEVTDKLRIERVCAKATRDLLDGIKDELRTIVNGRLTFGQMVLRIRRVLMEPTGDKT